MSDAVRETLEHARDLIAARGYQPGWKHSGPLNISAAIGEASTNYDQYCAARQAFSDVWGGPLKGGLLGWETETRRSQSDVLELFALVIERLEASEAHSEGRSRGSSGPRAV